MNEEGTGAAFRERINFALLITTALIYPLTLVIIFLTPNPTPPDLLGYLLLAVVLQVAALIILSTLAAVMTRKEPDDERLVAIQRRGAKVSGGLLEIGVISVISWMIAQSFMQPPEDNISLLASPLFSAYVLLAVFIVAQLAGMITMAIAYRRN